MVIMIADTIHKNFANYDKFFSNRRDFRDAILLKESIFKKSKLHGGRT